jgi:hypothetical protein
VLVARMKPEEGGAEPVGILGGGCDHRTPTVRTVAAFSM